MLILDFDWILIGFFIVDLLWIYCGFIVDLLWIYCGFIVDLLWIYCIYLDFGFFFFGFFGFLDFFCFVLFLFLLVFVGFCWFFFGFWFLVFVFLVFVFFWFLFFLVLFIIIIFFSGLINWLNFSGCSRSNRPLMYFPSLSVFLLSDQRCLVHFGRLTKILRSFSKFLAFNIFSGVHLCCLSDPFARNQTFFGNA
jgi:hypothetical protein